LKMDGIQIFLLDVACLDFMQNVVARKHEKWLPIFLSKLFFWMKKYNNVVIVFNFDF
jgi:hypothetical protein